MITDDQIERVCFQCPWPWTREELETVVARYRVGDSMRTIGKSIGLSHQAIRRALTILGIKIKKRGSRPKLDTIKKARVAKMIGMRFTHEEIARTLGVGRSTITDVAREVRDGIAV